MSLLLPRVFPQSWVSSVDLCVPLRSVEDIQLSGWRSQRPSSVVWVVLEAVILWYPLVTNAGDNVLDCSTNLAKLALSSFLYLRWARFPTQLSYEIKKLPGLTFFSKSRSRPIGINSDVFYYCMSIILLSMFYYWMSSNRNIIRNLIKKPEIPICTLILTSDSHVKFWF